MPEYVTDYAESVKMFLSVFRNTCFKLVSIVTNTITAAWNGTNFILVDRKLTKDDQTELLE